MRWSEGKHRIPEGLKMLVMKRDCFTCRMCGLQSGDESPFDDGPVRITIGFVVPLLHGGSLRDRNLRTICSICEEGLETMAYVKRPTTKWLISQLERISIQDVDWILQRAESKIVNTERRPA